MPTITSDPVSNRGRPMMFHDRRHLAAGRRTRSHHAEQEIEERQPDPIASHPLMVSTARILKRVRTA